MAKGQAGRRRAPAKRSRGGGGRMVLAFVAGVAVALAAGWWVLQHGRETGHGFLAGLRSAGQGGGKVETGAGGPRGETASPTEAGVGQTLPVTPKTVPERAAAMENGASGVPGEPVRAGAGTPPFGESEEVFEAGARVYGAQCASCHGRPGRSAAAEKGELAAGQFWTAKGGQAVAREPVGQIFRAIAEGQPERQMPAYKRVLTEAQMWDVALLLRNAGGELPDPVVTILRTGR